MLLYVDSVALIAPGEIHSIDILRHLPSRIVITPAIHDEVRDSARQIDDALSADCMLVETPNDTAVAELQEISRLHREEAELIEVAERITGKGAQMLVDEGRAFKYMQINGMTNLLCLAQVLHQLEEQGNILSCQSIMNAIFQPKKYLRAKVVRRHYEAWCLSTGHIPV